MDFSTFDAPIIIIIIFLLGGGGGGGADGTCVCTRWLLSSFVPQEQATVDPVSFDLAVDCRRYAPPSLE